MKYALSKWEWLIGLMLRSSLLSGKAAVDTYKIDRSIVVDVIVEEKFGTPILDSNSRAFSAGSAVSDSCILNTVRTSNLT
jgi:hypothetical protein